MSNAKPDPGAVTASRARARARAEVRAREIRKALASAWDLLAAAYRDEDWRALDYPDWQAYLDDQFRDRGRLARDQRAAVVAFLRDAGMSTRAIASATGESQSTVTREIRAGESDDSPAVKGTDGKSYPPKVIRVEVLEQETSPPASGPELAKAIRAVRAAAAAADEEPGDYPESTILEELELLTDRCNELAATAEEWVMVRATRGIPEEDTRRVLWEMNADLNRLLLTVEEHKPHSSRPSDDSA